MSAGGIADPLRRTRSDHDQGLGISDRDRLGRLRPAAARSGPAVSPGAASGSSWPQPAGDIGLQAPASRDHGDLVASQVSPIASVASRMPGRSTIDPASRWLYRDGGRLRPAAREAAAARCSLAAWYDRMSPAGSPRDRTATGHDEHATAAEATTVAAQAAERRLRGMGGYAGVDGEQAVDAVLPSV